MRPSLLALMLLAAVACGQSLYSGADIPLEEVTSPRYGLDTSWTFGTGSELTLNLDPSNAAALLIQDSAGLDFLKIATDTDAITFGNATSNPPVSFLGSGAVTIAGVTEFTSTPTFPAIGASDLTLTISGKTEAGQLGGSVTLETGSGGTGLASGTLLLRTGAGNGAGNGGAINVFGGAAGATGDAGDFNFTTGNAAGGDSGSIILNVGTASGTQGTIDLGATRGSLNLGNSSGTITAATAITTEGVQLPVGDALGVVAVGTGPNATTGMQLKVYDEVVSPVAITTNLLVVTNPMILVSAQGYVTSGLTGGGTTANWGIGDAAAANPVKYGEGTALTAADTADQIGESSLLNVISGETFTLNGITGGSVIGDTALTVGAVHIRIVYYELTPLGS